jgi:predicted acylesterase/phospholipase RssA
MIRFKMSYYKAVVLSGGSLNAICTLGALQYCYDNQLLQQVKIFYGTSAGGCIAYLLAIGYTPKEILAWLCVRNIFKDHHFDLLSMLNGNGAMSFTPFQEELERMTIEKVGYFVTFKQVYEQFHKELTLTVYNFTHHKVEYLNHETYPDMPCLVGLRMTTNLPLVFPLYKYLNNYYIDGGIGDMFPIRHASERVKGNPVLGVKLITDLPTDAPNLPILNYIYTLLNIVTNHQDTRVGEDLKGDVIELYGHSHSFNFVMPTKTIINYFLYGYEETKKYFHPI